MGVGPWQLAVIVLLLLLVLGASRLGEIGRGLGEGVRAFKKSIRGGERRRDDSEDEANEDAADDVEPPRRVGGRERRASERAVQNKRHVMAKKRPRKEDRRS